MIDKIVIWKARVTELKGESVVKSELHSLSLRALLKRMSHTVASQRTLEVYIQRTYKYVNQDKKNG